MLLLTALIIAFDPLRGGLPEREPASLGMSAVRLGAIERVVQRGIDAGGYPGASVVVGRKGYSVLSRGFGSLDWTRRTPVSVHESIYDLASLTKVIATTTAMMVLYDQGRLVLDAPVSKYLPDFSGGQKDQVTVRHLLTHRGGLPAGRALWRIARTPAQARAAVIATPLRCAPGSCYEYSDLGADLLGFIAEAVSQEPLDRFLEREVFAKLGMTDTHFHLSPTDAARSAPTEIAPPRGYPLRGEVHDENAFALGGIAGHAGLFSTASDLSVFAQMLLEGGKYAGVRVVSDSTVALFTKRAAGRRALGWDTCDGGAGCGQHLSERAFGHTGFTGTSIWIDPDRQDFVILLTNRVHAARATSPSKIIADVRNDLADAAVLAVMDAPGGVLAMPVSFRADVAADWNRPLRSVRARSTAASRRAAALRRSKAAASRGSSAKSKAIAKARTSAAVVKGRSATPARASTAVATKSTKTSRSSATKKKSTTKQPTMKAATPAPKKPRR